MEFESLNYTLDYLASCGAVFSVEHRIAIQSSLVLLCNDNHFEDVHFWGKIHGTENDYYVAYGIGKDYLKDRQYFYSINHGLQWIVLPPPTAVVMEMGLSCKGRFVGDPTADSETDIVPNDSDVIEEGDQFEYIKEEERLSATVALITAEAGFVPRGFLMKSPTGLIYQNKTFEGLSKDDALQLVSYFHVRRPSNPWDKSIVGRPDYNLTLDFLDSLANDLPIGSWTIQMDKLENTATVRSLYWPGAQGAAVVSNGRRCITLGGSLNAWWYIGTGKKNWDVPFMILPPPNITKASVVADSAYMMPEDGTTNDLYGGYGANPIIEPPRPSQQSISLTNPGY